MREVRQLVTIMIQYKDLKIKKINLGLRHRTTLKFIAETYFGTLSKGNLELWDEDGERITTMSMPKGNIIQIYNNLFVVLNK